MGRDGKIVRGVIACAWLPSLLAGAAVGAERIRWTAVPSLEDIHAAYPQGAYAAGIGALVVINCRMEGGGLGGCTVAKETPKGEGFGAAALSLAPRFKAKSGRSKVIALPIRFLPQPPAPGGPAPPERAPIFRSTAVEYRYLGGPGPYYPMRAAARDIPGEAVIDCHLLDTGRLENCVLVSATPAGHDFDVAALDMAYVGWMTAEPRIEDGQPVVMETVRVRVSFKAKRYLN